nr:hypothetical protein [Tanacetum cinerariifolium]
MLKKKHKSRRIHRKETEVPHTEPQTEESIPKTSNDPLPSGEDRVQLTKLMNLGTNLQKQVLDLEKAKTAQANEIANLKKKVKKLERKKKSRTLGDQDDASKQGRMIDNIDQNEEITLVDETLRRMNEKGMFRLNDLDGDEVIMDATAGEEVEQSTKVTKNEVSTADPVTTVEDVKGKGIMVEPEKPLKKKDQIAFDEEVARKLIAHMKAKMEEEERIAREKDEANIAVIEQWNEIQAKIDDDMELVQKLQTKEQEQLIDAEKARLFMEFLEKRRKFFARKREIEKRNKPPTKSQQRNLIADGSSKRYSSMIQMLQHIDREDLETLWMLVKAKYGNTRPEDGYERVLWGDLKVMFEPDIESKLWRKLHGNKVIIWKLFSSCGVHFVRFQNLNIFMLVEKRYPLAVLQALKC